MGIALGLLFEGRPELSSTPNLLSVGGKDGLFIIFVFAGVLAGLALLIPAGIEHSTFIKAHPFIEDFYTDDDRLHARTSFSRGLIAGIAAIFIGMGSLIILGEHQAHVALFLMLTFVALGTWSIVRYGMLLGRTNIAEYNNATDELEVEHIVSAQISESVRASLLNKHKRSKKLKAVCDAIMLIATVVGLGLLFAPAIVSGDPSNFEPEGTTAMWFWLAWPVGGIICGIVSALWKAFAHNEDK